MPRTQYPPVSTVEDYLKQFPPLPAPSSKKSPSYKIDSLNDFPPLGQAKPKPGRIAIVYSTITVYPPENTPSLGEPKTLNAISIHSLDS